MKYQTVSLSREESMEVKEDGIISYFSEYLSFNLLQHVLSKILFSRERYLRAETFTTDLPYSQSKMIQKSLTNLLTVSENSKN